MQGMSRQADTPEARYAMVVEALLGEDGVTCRSMERRGFGSTELKVGEKIFAMLSKGRLVVKLPRARVDALVAAGMGERFDPGHGRLMKEWVAIAPASQEEWLPLAREALAFVAATS
jgi:TfoX/Sxy family transcriptional regulator of competence genes